MKVPHLHNWIQRGEEIASAVHTAFLPLDATALNWKPSPGSWSIGQCLDHLVVTNESYFPALRGVLDEKRYPDFWERFNPLSQYTGRNMAKTLGKDSKKKFSAPRLFRPGPGDIRPGVVRDFLNNQDSLLDFIRKIEAGGWTEKIITSPVSKLITFPVADGLEIIIGHEERHIVQAQALYHHPGFPKK